MDSGPVWRGNPFEALYAGQVTCLDVCQEKRRRELRSASDMAYRLHRKAKAEALKSRVAELEAEVERMKAADAELARVKAELEDARQDLAHAMEERDVARAALQAVQQCRAREVRAGVYGKDSRTGETSAITGVRPAQTQGRLAPRRPLKQPRANCSGSWKKTGRPCRKP
ncbi:hypothetical protein [uncultured Desulfovibrio sp.]|uniref:hypothetical protein n=1 Tax=uncultured Desulfovibrio sp. TaxID=167968 RepID=UPI002627FAC0|nr:hypothetical protein [uncultured Desulfovibrio sp.]